MRLTLLHEAAHDPCSCWQQVAFHSTSVVDTYHCCCVRVYVLCHSSMLAVLVVLELLLGKHFLQPMQQLPLLC